jgi:hypothetical protein
MKMYVKFKRLASLTLFILLLSLPLTAWADEEKGEYDATVMFGDVKGSVGEVVNVPVKVGQVKKEIATYGIQVDFDNKHVKVVGIQPEYGSTSQTCAEETAGCFWSNVNNEEGFLRVAWADPTAGDHPIHDSLKLFTIQVEISKTDYIGESNLSIKVKDLESLSFIDPSNHPLKVGMDSGKLSIVEKTKTDTTKGKNNTTDKVNLDSLPKTGDDSYIDTILNSAIAVLAASLLIMWFYKRRQKREKTN